MPATLSFSPQLPPAWVLLLAAPVLEELVFRSGLQETLLRRWPEPRGAAWAGGTTAHAGTRGWALGLAVLAPAWLIGRVYQHTRHVPACMALHAMFNLGWWLLCQSSLGSYLSAHAT